MNTLTEWLAKLGLSQFEPLLASHEIDLEAMQFLSDADLAMLGIPLGPRRKLLDSIASLRSSGTPLRNGPPHSGERSDQPLEEPSEHRQLSVMFVDLVGWSELSERTDQERLAVLLRRYHDVCTQVIQRHEGHVAQYLGDGVLVYFGYPRAHENNAERAVRTGLDIVSTIKDMNRQLRNEDLPELQVRVGIHTALTIVGQVGGQGRHEQLAVGPAPNLAARIQAIAEPGTVLIGASTRSLVARNFRCVDLGVKALKGARQPIHVYRVLGPRTWDTRFAAARAGRLTPLVGRQREIGTLWHHWQLAREGAGQVVCVVGEAGIGKSRLIDALRESLQDAAPTEVILQCLPHFANTPLHPIVKHTNLALGIAAEDTPATRLDKIEALLVHRLARPVDDAKLMASLLSVPFEEKLGPLNLPPLRLRAETIRMLVDVLLTAARRQPILLVVEDAHWADPTTLEVLRELARRTLESAVLMIITHRTDFTAATVLAAGALQISLERLSPTQAKAFVAHLTEKKRLAPDMVERIVARSDGIPLFLEEMTKSVLESVSEGGGVNVGANPIPATLRDSLMARLDRVPGGKVVAQIGAILGREFSHALVTAIGRELHVDPDRALRGLTEAGLVHSISTRDDVVFQFKHALVQDLAAESLVRPTRHALHARAARLLERMSEHTNETPPELLAHHYTEACEFTLAVPYWIQAGKRAASRLAHIEAMHHFDQAARLLRHYPDSDARARIELDLLVARGAVLVTLRGYAAPDVERTYERARELCPRVADPVLECSVLRGQVQLLLLQARYREARTLAVAMRLAAEGTGELAQLVDAHMMSGIIAIYDGRLAEAARELDRALQRLDPGGYRHYGISNGVDLGIGCLAYHARVLWFLGLPDSALRSANDALALASRPAVWLGAVQAHGMRALLHQTLGDVEDARASATLTAKHAAEQCIPYWEAVAGIVLGWVDAQTGHVEEALERIRAAWQFYLSTGASLGTSWIMTVLADAQRRSGDTDAALSSLGAALDHVKTTGELYFAPEVWRMVGELRESSSPKEAERCYLESQRIAQQTGALAWDLRTSIRLARLWQSQGKAAQAQGMLGARLVLFREGLDTSDLKEAAHLFASLEASILGTRSLIPHSQARSSEMLLAHLNATH